MTEKVSCNPGCQQKDSFYGPNFSQCSRVAMEVSAWLRGCVQPPAMPRQPVLSQEEKEARARERDRLKKRRRREDGLRRSLERQRNALAMRRRRWEKREARRRMCQEAELQGLAFRLGGEAWEWRQQRREEQAKVLDRELATMVQLRQEEERLETGPSLIWVLAWAIAWRQRLYVGRMWRV